jgi:hypothetical protein
MSEEKKIIIDEDWKSQVAAEKEAAERQAREKPRGVADSPGAAAGAAAHEPLEASFELLITTFVTEAMAALGQLPHPATGALEFDPAHARFAIDMLEVIAEKTKGNLTPDEERGLQQVVHQLRMAFVAVSSQQSAVSQKEDGGTMFSG